jgi:HK97 family phage major capsid protein
LTVGTGAADILGVVHAATVGVSAASASAITADEVLRLVDSAPSAWRWAPTSVLMCTSDTYSALRRLKDGDGAYQWVDDPTGQTRGVLGGVRVILNKFMPAIGSEARPLVYLDLDRLIIRDVDLAMLQILTETYAASGQTGYQAHARHGGLLLNVGDVPAAVCLQMAA